jgi:hypothetical protein
MLQGQRLMDWAVSMEGGFVVPASRQSLENLSSETAVLFPASGD